MEAFTGFLLGIVASLSAAAIWAVAGDRILHVLSGARFSLSGIWLAIFEPISPVTSTSVEVVTMRQYRDTVRLYIENYNDVRDSVIICKGLGKYRASQLSAVYYLIGKGQQDSGTFALRSRSSDTGDTVLEGVYTQVFDRCEKRGVSLKSGQYFLRRIAFPCRHRLRRLLRGTFFESYDDIDAWLSLRGYCDEEPHSSIRRSRSV